MGVIASLLVRLGVDNSGVEKGIDGASGMFAKAGPMLATAALAAGALAGAALVKGVSDAMAAEKANDKLAAQLGLPPDLAAEAGRAAGKIYSQAYGESLTDVNDAIASVARNITGLDEGVTPEVEAITKSVMSLGEAFNQDVGETSRAVGKMIKTGLAKDANQAMDILTRGFQQGANEADDLLDTVSEYSTQFRVIGLSGEQAMGLLSQGLKAGARDADTVADSLKEFAIRSIDGSKTTAEGFKAIGLSADKMATQIAKGGPESAAALDLTLDRLRAMKDPVERNAAAVALFGTKAEDLGAALFSLDPSEAVASLGKVEGAAESMSATLHDNAATTWESYKRRALGVLQSIGAGALTFSSAIGSKLSDAGVFDAAKGVWDEYKDHASQSLGMLKEIVGPAVKELADALGLDSAEDIKARLDGLQTTAAEAFGWLRDEAKPVMEEIAATIREDVIPAVDQVSAAWDNNKATLMPVADFIGGVLLVTLGSMWTSLRFGVNVLGWLVRAIGFLITLGLNQLSLGIKLVKGGWTLMISQGQAVGRFFTSTLPGWIGTAVTWLKSLPGKAASAVSGLASRIKGAVGDLGGLLLGAGRSVVEGLIRGIGEKIGALKSKLSSVTSLIPDWKGPPEKDARLLFPAGQLLIAGLTAGIESQMGSLESTLGAVTARVGATPMPDLATRVNAMPLGRQVRAGDGGDTGGTRHYEVHLHAAPGIPTERQAMGLLRQVEVLYG